jgi:hypothetical protein
MKVLPYQDKNGCHADPALREKYLLRNQIIRYAPEDKLRRRRRYHVLP